MELYLQQGTVLDDKYQIGKVIGHGGFGITYEGVISSHTRTKVAVKELFISEYMCRDAKSSDEVLLIDECYRSAFEKAKEDFLKEAIILGIMNKEPAVVNVIDRFKANGTAYIVMEYVEGMTLLQYWKEHGNFQDKEIFKKVLPLISTLRKVHDNQVIHGDISPENIMVQEDGTLKLIDFGSAGNYMSREMALKTVKDGYASAEQYTKDGATGPWTDIYSLCATIYFCITGKVPESAAQRTLYDELEKPSELGVKIEDGLEQILWKGISVDAKERYQTMEELETELRKVIPEEKRKLPVMVKAVGAAVLATVLITASAVGYEYYKEKNKFNGIETQKAVLVPDEEMTVSNFVEARRIVEERIQILAGETPYSIEEDEDGCLSIITALSVFENYDAQAFYDMMISGVWNTEIGKYVESSGTYLRCDIDNEDFVSVALQLGANDNMTAEQSELIHPEANRYIYLVLTDEKAKEIREVFPQESILNLYMDFRAEEEIHDSISVSLSEDGKEMYLYGNFIQKGNFGDLLTYNLSHQTYEQPFRLYCEITADWESPDDSMLTGEYQRREGEISDPAVTVSYSQNDQSALNLSKGEWAYILVNLKERLDQFKIPYAIGAEKDDARQIVLKMEAADTNAFVLNSLMEKGHMVTIAGRWKVYGTPVSPQNTSMELIHSQEEGYQYLVRLDKENWKNFQKFTEELLASGINELFIRLGEYYVAQCTIEEPVTDGRIIFDHLCDENESMITEENRYLFDYLSTFALDTSGFANYELDKVVFTDAKGEIDVEQKFQEEEYITDFAEEFLEKAVSLYPQITYETEFEMRNNGVSICLNLDMSDSFVDRSLEMIERIYRECGMQEGWLDNITFTLTRENAEDAESAQIYFGKTQEQENDYIMNVMFQNGRMEWYKEEMEEALTENPFFAERLNTINGQRISENVEE